MKLRLLAAACTFAFSALACANGNLDPAYGAQADGRVIVPFDLGSPPTEQAAEALIDSDNRTYIIGRVKTADGLFQTGMTRLLPNGRVDQSFGVGGRSVTTATAWSRWPAAAAFAGNGAILTAERRDFGDDAYFSVCNHNSETGISAMFDGNNVACVFINPIENGNDFVQDILVQPDGKIVLVGYSRNLAQKYIGTVVRLNSNGSIDNTFSGDGIAFIDLGDATLPHAAAWTTENGGSIMLCGAVRAPGSAQTDMLAVRLRGDNGALDTGFSVDGRSAYFFADQQSSEICNAIAVRRDGVFFIAGQATVNGVNKGAIKAVAPGGSSMANFAGGGLIIEDSGTFVIDDVKLRADGSPVVLGTRADGQTDLHVVAMTTTGALQSGFGTVGQRSIDFGLPGQSELAAAMVLQNGRPVVVGHALTAPGQGYDFVAARLDTDVIFADGFIR